MLEIKNVSKSFTGWDGATVNAIQDVSMDIHEREFVSIVGLSGCGKTTLLRMIAGLESVDGAHIRFNGRPVQGPARERGMVFQSFALFPWMTVQDNIASGLRFAGKSEALIRETVNRYLILTGLEKFATAYPMSLSGGMKQRVAIARTLANDPEIILMDEPFGALDAQTRSSMQEFLADLWDRERKTVVFVTHDIEEAIFLSDRVVVLSPRPAVIREVVPVPFARPRGHGLKLSPEFYAMKTRIMRLLESPAVTPR